jgi:hypothetical protein
MSERRIEKRSCIGQVISTIADLEARVITYPRHGLASSEGTTNVAVLAARFIVTEDSITELVLACFMERREEGGPLQCGGLARNSGDLALCPK